MRLSYRLLASLLVAVAFALPPCLRAQDIEAPTVVLVVRHAEKAAEPASDPPLTEAGRARARALIDVVADANVTSILSSQYRRTQETVAPLAEHLGLEVTTMEVDNATLPTYPRRLAEKALHEHRGETVLIVNHSNTIPRIVEALGGEPVPPIAEDDYDDLFVVIVPPSGPARTIRAQQGY